MPARVAGQAVWSCGQEQLSEVRIGLLAVARLRRPSRTLDLGQAVFLLVTLRLQGEQVGIGTVFCKQRLVRPAFDDPAAI